jgi:hypothetical protein
MIGLRNLTVALGVMIGAVGLSGCGAAAPAVDAASLTAYDCAMLAKEAVSLSKGEDIKLIKVRSPKIVKDNRKTYKKPTGDDDALVLSCMGAGVWSDSTDSPVLLDLTVDADGDPFVAYKEA